MSSQFICYTVLVPGVWQATANSQLFREMCGCIKLTMSERNRDENQAGTARVPSQALGCAGRWRQQGSL